MRNIMIIKEYFMENESKSIHKGSNDLISLFPRFGPSCAKAYKLLKVNRLMKSNMSNQVAFAPWLFSQPDCFEQKVC